jgi:hypothetical protein
MTICPACGTPSVGALQCPACGASLVADGSAAAPAAGMPAEPAARDAVIDVQVREVSDD